MNRPALSPKMIRTLVACAFLAAAVLFAQSQDALREVTRPIVLALLRIVGIAAKDQGEMMSIGNLNVPWTRDCAGMNLLIIMLALAVWVNRDEENKKKFWLRVTLTFPAALAANVLRVFSLIGYRWLAYPAVESPQMHYFLGFFWMVPFISMITPRSDKPRAHAWLETLHAAATVSLLTPALGMPNGSMVAIAAIIALAQCRIRLDHLPLRAPLTVAWLVVGGLVATMNMESFWLPWLLCCPCFIDLRWALKPAGAIVLLSTHALFAMQSWAPYIGWSAIAFAVWKLTDHSSETNPHKEHFPRESRNAPQSQRITRAIIIACIPCFIAPFLASTLLTLHQPRWQPPASVESRILENKGFEIRLPNQPDNMALVCYGPEGNDRHHTLKVCLKYRGTDLTPSAENPIVFTDGEHWMRECFFQNNQLLLTYHEYLASTFAPRSHPGVHFIFITPKERMTPNEFAEKSKAFAEAFHKICITDQEIGNP